MPLKLEWREYSLSSLSIRREFKVSQQAKNLRHRIEFLLCPSRFSQFSIIFMLRYNTIKGAAHRTKLCVVNSSYRNKVLSLIITTFADVTNVRVYVVELQYTRCLSTKDESSFIYILTKDQLTRLSFERQMFLCYILNMLTLFFNLFGTQDKSYYTRIFVYIRAGKHAKLGDVRSHVESAPSHPMHIQVIWKKTTKTGRFCLRPCLET
jgi:hypothetical protein